MGQQGMNSLPFRGRITSWPTELVTDRTRLAFRDIAIRHRFQEQLAMVESVGVSGSSTGGPKYGVNVR